MTNCVLVLYACMRVRMCIYCICVHLCACVHACVRAQGVSALPLSSLWQNGQSEVFPLRRHPVLLCLELLHEVAAHHAGRGEEKGATKHVGCLVLRKGLALDRDMTEAEPPGGRGGEGEGRGRGGRVEGRGRGREIKVYGVRTHLLPSPHYHSASAALALARAE